MSGIIQRVDHTFVAEKLRNVLNSRLHCSQSRSPIKWKQCLSLLLAGRSVLGSSSARESTAASTK